MRLYLIRHGETDYNRQHIMQGHSEQPLNDLGIRQAAALARAMAALPLDHIYASDIRRAAMTAAIIAAATGAPITWEPLLRERNPGIYTHRPYAEAQGFFVDPEFAPEGGENVPVFEARVAEAVKAILEREGDAHPRRHIAAVTHGMFCAAFIRVLGLEPEGGAIRWPNASMTVADYTDGKWRIATLAETGHLEEEALGAVISLPAREAAENGGATGG